MKRMGGRGGGRIGKWGAGRLASRWRGLWWMEAGGERWGSRIGVWVGRGGRGVRRGRQGVGFQKGMAAFGQVSFCWKARTGNCKSKSEIQGFFALLRMTIVFGSVRVGGVV